MKRMQTDDNSEQLDLLMSSLNAIKKELRAIKTNMTFESKLAYINQDLMAMLTTGILSGTNPSSNGSSESWSETRDTSAGTSSPDFSWTASS